MPKKKAPTGETLDLSVQAVPESGEKTEANSFLRTLEGVNRRIAPEDKIPGIHFISESSRVYPPDAE